MDRITPGTLRDAHTSALESMGNRYDTEIATACWYFDLTAADPTVRPHLRDGSRLEVVKAGLYLAAHTFDWKRLGDPGPVLASLLAGGHVWTQGGADVVG
jgi:hypothetical protein